MWYKKGLYLDLPTSLIFLVTSLKNATKWCIVSLYLETLLFLWELAAIVNFWCSQVKNMEAFFWWIWAYFWVALPNFSFLLYFWLAYLLLVSFWGFFPLDGSLLLNTIFFLHKTTHYNFLFSLAMLQSLLQIICNLFELYTLMLKLFFVLLFIEKPF